MKRILTAAAALLFSVAIFAQSSDSPPPSSGQGGPPSQMRGRSMSPAQRAKRETDQINSLAPLGDAYQKVLDINTQDATKMESIANGTKRSDMTEDQRSQLKALRESHKQNLKAALGPDLYAKYEAAKKAQMEQRRNQNNGQSSPGGPQGNGN
jgi:Spy/CpxP family protein refolding chaperone